MLVQSLIMFLTNPVKVIVSILSISLAILILISLKKIRYDTRTKVILVYLHLFFFVLPLILFGYSLSCDMGLFKSIIPECATALVKAIIYSIPFVIIFAASLGYIFIPNLYLKNAKEFKEKNLKQFISKYSKRLKIKVPRLYIIDTAKPLAFSFYVIKSAVFLSIGMLELLTKKELQSVLLHELNHIKNRSSLLKFSSHLLRFSPFSYFTRFNNELNKEEIEADNFAIKIQKTYRYINSVKEKLNKYDNER